MGLKGDKQSKTGAFTKDLILEKLVTFEGISSKKMFGGFGIFNNNSMFGMVDSKGEFYLKATDQNQSTLNNLKAQKHSRMPYFQLRMETINSEKFLELVNLSIE